MCRNLYVGICGDPSQQLAPQSAQRQLFEDWCDCSIGTVSEIWVYDAGVYETLMMSLHHWNNQPVIVLCYKVDEAAHSPVFRCLNLEDLHESFVWGQYYFRSILSSVFETARYWPNLLSNSFLMVLKQASRPHNPREYQIITRCAHMQERILKVQGSTCPRDVLCYDDFTGKQRLREAMAQLLEDTFMKVIGASENFLLCSSSCWIFPGIVQLLSESCRGALPKLGVQLFSKPNMQQHQDCTGCMREIKYWSMKKARSKHWVRACLCLNQGDSLVSERGLGPRRTTLINVMLCFALFPRQTHVNVCLTHTKQTPWPVLLAHLSLPQSAYLYHAWERVVKPDAKWANWWSSLFPHAHESHHILHGLTLRGQYSLVILLLLPMLLFPKLCRAFLWTPRTWLYWQAAGPWSTTLCSASQVPATAFSYLPPTIRLLTTTLRWEAPSECTRVQVSQMCYLLSYVWYFVPADLLQ